MKPLLLIVAVALAAIAIAYSGDEAPTNSAICPECPGGVCPVKPAINHAPDGSLVSLQEKIPVQVEPVPVFTLAKHEKSLIKPEIKKPEKKVLPHRLDNAWRLRLLYTKGDRQAVKLQHWFENRMPVISKKYDFMAISTEDGAFEPWEKAGFNPEKPTLVLACPDNSYALRTTDIPSDIDELRKLIRESAEKFKDHQ